MRPETRSKLEGVFRQVLVQPKLEIREDMTASDVKGWDSLNHATLIFAAEKSFGIKFSTREVQGLKNVGEFASLIEQKQPK